MNLFPSKSLSDNLKSKTCAELSRRIQIENGRDSLQSPPRSLEPSRHEMLLLHPLLDQFLGARHGAFDALAVGRQIESWNMRVVVTLRLRLSAQAARSNA